MSFTELVSKYKTEPKQDFLKYLQIRHCVIKKFSSVEVGNPIVE